MTDTFTHWRSPYIEQLSTTSTAKNYRWKMDVSQVAEALKRITGGTSTPTITDNANNYSTTLDTTVTLPAPLHGVTSIDYYFSFASSSYYYYYYSGYMDAVWTDKAAVIALTRRPADISHEGDSSMPSAASLWLMIEDGHLAVPSCPKNYGINESNTLMSFSGMLNIPDHEYDLDPYPYLVPAMTPDSKVWDRIWVATNMVRMNAGVEVTDGSQHFVSAGNGLYIKLD